MNTEKAFDPNETKEVIDEIQELGYSKLIKDRALRREFIYGFLAENAKGPVADLAKRMREGNASSIEIMSDPTYVEFINEGLKALKDLSPDALRDQLDELNELDELEETPDDPLTLKMEDWAAKFSDFEDSDEKQGQS